MKKILLVLTLSTYYFLLTTNSVLASCSEQTASGCWPGYTCRYDYFSSRSLELCSDKNSSQCFCTDDSYVYPTATPTSTPAPSGSPNPTATPLPTGTPGPTSTPPDPPVAPPGSCSGPALDKTSRPNECAACKTDLLTPACATTFTANDEIKFRTSEVDFMCNSGDGEQAWLRRSWGGIAQINFKQGDKDITKLPFVAKKNDPSEEKYLADYFEGTNIYRPEMDLSACQVNPTAECQDKLKNILLTAGVWQKLAPIDIQDNYKREIIKRSLKEQLHDYQIEAGTFSTTLSGFATHLKPDYQDFKTLAEYASALSSWQSSDAGKWASLWTYVPMFSREDTEGKIMPYMGKIPSPPGEDKFEILGEKPIVEKVPHLARLYEVTKAINKLLVPSEKQTTTAKVKTENLASQGETLRNQSVVLGEETNECFNVTQEVVADPVEGGAMISVTLHLCSPPGGGDGHVRVWVNGTETITNDAWNSKNGTNCYTVVPERSGGWVFVPYGGSLPQRNYEIQIDRCHGNFATKKLSLCASLDKNGQVTNKCGPMVTPPPTPLPACGLPGPKKVANCTPKEVLTDPGGDGLCCSASSMRVSAMDTFVNTSYPSYQKNYGPCFDRCMGLPGMTEAKCDNRCDPLVSHKVSRSIALSLQHPYLDQIWEQTAQNLSGFMNIFKVDQDFEDLPAATKILYSFTPNGSSSNTADPQIGDFYFPHLGGIQKAKQMIISLLNPLGSDPANTKPPGILNYTLPFRNSSININTANKIAVIQKVKKSWPAAQIDTKWDYVVSQAKSHGFNPAFVLALWIEESGANGVEGAWGLGCGVYSGVKKDIENQLDCLFSLPYKNASFEEFMCQYSEGKSSPCTFFTNPNFPFGIQSWYNQLTQ